MFLAAAIQMCSGRDKAANLAIAERLVREAAAGGARLVVLPEVFLARGKPGDETALAESVPGPETGRLAALARELGIHLQAGSLLEQAEGPRAWNTALLFSPSGEIVGTYRKMHLFDVDIPEAITVRESDHRIPGDRVVAVDTELGTIGLSICYDLRFPELYRQLVRRHAEIVVVPSAFTDHTGAAHWETLLRARAIENQVYVIAANQYGTSPSGHRDHGHSMIVDPWGTVIARAGEGEGIAIAPIRRDYLAEVRRKLPALRHVRLLPPEDGDG